MLKKLDKLILKAFAGPFIATFFIVFFVLMLQILWKYVDDLVGKGLDLITIAEFLWYASASLLTLALPIAVLIASIMTFGNLGETFELVAIKSAGISLLRFMRPIAIVAVILSFATFLIANYVIPVANLKFRTLYWDISHKKPALDLKEGTFFKYIPGYSIKVGKKHKDGKTIDNVLIYEQQGSTLQDNSIIAERGIMLTSKDKKYLELNLYNGNRYQERGAAADTNTEFIQVSFKDYKKMMDLSSLQMTNTSEEAYKNDYRMLSIRQLQKYTDSLQRSGDSISKKINKEVAFEFHYNNIPDSIWRKTKILKDTAKGFITIVPDSLRSQVLSYAEDVLMRIRNSYSLSGAELTIYRQSIRYNDLEWHRKFSLSLSCLVLFFIGAPLGSIIRKGGLGMPLVIAVIFFTLFHLLNMFGEKFVKEGLLSPFTGMWLAVLVLTPIGVFLTYKAMHDSQLFNKEFYYRAFRRIRSVLNR